MGADMKLRVCPKAYGYNTMPAAAMFRRRSCFMGDSTG
jgi:hypothetical protein